MPTSFEVKLVQVGDISEQSPSLTVILQKRKFILLCVGKMFHLKTTCLDQQEQLLTKIFILLTRSAWSIGLATKSCLLVPQFLFDREIAAKQAGSVRMKVTNFL